MPTKSEIESYIATHEKDRVAELCGLHLFEDRIAKLPTWRNGRTHPDGQLLTDVQARTEAAGMISNSAFASAGMGVTAGRTRSKADKVWVVVDGPTFQWQVRLPGKYERRARRFVELVNNVARMQAQLSEG